MTTFSDLISEVQANLRGFVRDQNLSTYLTSPMTSSDLTMAVSDSSVLSRGLCEIEDELIYLESVNRTSNTVTIPPYGRGQEGTTAASHSQNVKVTFNPLFPRNRVKQAINETVNALSGTLYSVATTTLTTSSGKFGYELPAGTRGIISVEWENSAALNLFTPVRRYRLDQMADTTYFPSGVSLEIIDAVPPGRIVRIYYTKDLVTFSSDSDNFTITGLLERARDVVMYGTLMRLASALDIANLTTNALERQAFEGYGKQSIGEGTNLTKFYAALYQQRLNEELAYLNNTYPIRPYHTR